MRWPVERSNSWLSNFAQLRRNTVRFAAHRLEQFALATNPVDKVNARSRCRHRLPMASVVAGAFAYRLRIEADARWPCVRELGALIRRRARATLDRGRARSRLRT